MSEHVQLLEQPNEVWLATWQNVPATLAVTGVVPAVDQVQAAEPEVQGGMIVGEQVDVYATEGSLLPVLGTLAADTPVKILRVSGDWTRILIRGGIDVWVFDQFLSLIHI